MSCFSKAFLAAAGERAVKTFAQTLAALLAGSGTGVLSVDWGARLSVALMAALVSLLTSVASGGVGSPGPSLANEGLSARGASAPAHTGSSVSSQSWPLSRRFASAVPSRTSSTRKALSKNR